VEASGSDEDEVHTDKILITNNMKEGMERMDVK
jgi:hypothetical protein